MAEIVQGQIFTTGEVVQLFFDGNLLDARKGGLVLGEPHPNQIFLLSSPVLSSVIQVVASIEGGEYILSVAASEKYEERFDEINADLEPTEPLGNVSITEHSRLFNLVGDGNKFLLVDPNQAVVNKHATAKNLEELELMNALLK